jgi:putative acetyltransferase
MKIILDDLSGKEITALLQLHLENMASISPPESCHALAVDSLKDPDISVWSAWDGDDLLGCGALKKIARTHGEIKSMRTVAAHLHKGVAANLLRHIINTASDRGYQHLSLETGSAEEFLPARKLYEKFGFSECGPFADYQPDPLSTFMTIKL